MSTLMKLKKRREARNNIYHITFASIIHIERFKLFLQIYIITLYQHYMNINISEHSDSKRTCYEEMSVWYILSICLNSYQIERIQKMFY